MKNQHFIQTIWTQVFRDELVIVPERFLSANVVVGLFSIVVLLADAQHPERASALSTTLFAVTAATHIGGLPAAMLAPERVRLVLLVQGVSLFASALALTGTTLWLAYRAEALTNFHYLPGMVITLLTYAALEIHFFGRESWSRFGVRRAGVLLGLAGEALLASLLVWRLLHHTH
jgi:hypothetical protein